MTRLFYTQDDKIFLDRKALVDVAIERSIDLEEIYEIFKVEKLEQLGPIEV